MSDLILYFGCFVKKKKKKYWVLFDSKFQVFLFLLKSWWISVGLPVWI